MSKRRTSGPGSANTEPAPPLPPVVAPPSEAFTEAVLRELALLEEAKRTARRVPVHTQRRELVAHLSAALNCLYRQGRIRVGDTVNDKYIIINQI